MEGNEILNWPAAICWLCLLEVCWPVRPGVAEGVKNICFINVNATHFKFEVMGG